MNGFHQMQEIYYDALHLQQELEKIPDECECSDGAAHLSGKCSCCRLMPEDTQVILRLLTGGNGQHGGGGCGAALETLKSSVSRFKWDRAEGKIAWGDLSLGERRWYFLIENAVDALEGRLVKIEREIREFQLTCSHAPLRTLKKCGEDLKRYLEGLLAGEANDASSSGWSVKVEPALFAPAAKVGFFARNENEAVELTALPAATEEVIKSLIEKHQICYEYWGESAIIKGARTKIGYNLRFCGINEHANGEHSVPGCPHCRRTYRDLRRIAEWILPAEEAAQERETQFKIEPFDNSFHIAPKDRKSRAEVVVTIQILHKRDINRPVDDCEDRCLKEMRGKLKELGVLEGRWNDKRRGPKNIKPATEATMTAEPQCENPQEN